MTESPEDKTPLCGDEAKGSQRADDLSVERRMRRLPASTGAKARVILAASSAANGIQKHGYWSGHGSDEAMRCVLSVPAKLSRLCRTHCQFRGTVLMLSTWGCA